MRWSDRVLLCRAQSGGRYQYRVRPKVSGTEEACGLMCVVCQIFGSPAAWRADARLMSGWRSYPPRFDCRSQRWKQCRVSPEAGG